MLDCDGNSCICLLCAENESNNGNCSHCCTCFNGCKADTSITECFKKLKIKKVKIKK